MKKKVRQWMKTHAVEFVDSCGELNCTALAEAAAAEFDQDERGGWLDDPDHWIWEIPVDIADQVEEAADGFVCKCGCHRSICAYCGCELTPFGSNLVCLLCLWA